MSGLPTGWSRVYMPRPAAQLRLVCFPQAGAGASVFHGWAQRLPESIELVAVQYPGRQDRRHEEPFADLEALAAAAAQALQPLFDRPVAFFGHSLGAIVAFEVARRLQPRFPTPLERFIVSARRSPAQRAANTYDFSRDEDLRHYLSRLGNGAMVLRDQELWGLLVPALRADLLMSQRYRYAGGAPLTCPLILVAAGEDRGCTIEDMRGWSGYTISSTQEYVIGGDHYYVDTPPAELFAILAGAASREFRPTPER